MALTGEQRREGSSSLPQGLPVVVLVGVFVGGGLVALRRRQLLGRTKRLVTFSRELGRMRGRAASQGQRRQRRGHHQDTGTTDTIATLNDSVRRFLASHCSFHCGLLASRARFHPTKRHSTTFAPINGHRLGAFYVRTRTRNVPY